jgi:hypothetical protein
MKQLKANNLKIVEFNKINAKKENEKRNQDRNLPDISLKKIYNLKIPQSPEVINIR